MAEYIPLSEFASQLGVSEEKVQSLREQGKLRAFRDGSSWKFKDTELEKARTVLSEEGPAGGGSQEFELGGSLDFDEGSSGSMDSLLIEDTGEGGEAGGSHIIHDGDEGPLGLADSDIGLADEPAGPSASAADTNVGDLDLLGGSDILGTAPTETPIESQSLDLHDEDDLSLADEEGDVGIGIGDEPRDAEGTGSQISLGLADEEESLDLGTSGIGLEEESSGELSLDIEDDEDSSMDLLASESELGIADDPAAMAEPGSEINLEGDEDFDLVGEPSGLELISEDEPAPKKKVDQARAASAISASDDEELMEPVSGVGEDDFLLTPVEGELDDDDSGSQVIALDSDSMSSDSGLFGSATLEQGDFGGLGESDGLEADENEAPSGMAVAAPMATAPAEVPYSAMNVLTLGITAFVLMLAGFMVMDLMWNMWSYNEPYALSSTLMDSILSLLS